MKPCQSKVTYSLYHQHGNAPNDQYTVIELNVPAVPQVAQPTPIEKENIEPLPDDAQEGRFKVVTDEDTDQFMRENINKSTNNKTKSDMKIFTENFHHIFTRFGMSIRHPLGHRHVCCCPSAKSMQLLSISQVTYWL
jgi:hypothetical protein